MPLFSASLLLHYTYGAAMVAMPRFLISRRLRSRRHLIVLATIFTCCVLARERRYGHGCATAMRRHHYSRLMLFRRQHAHAWRPPSVPQMAGAVQGAHARCASVRRPPSHFEHEHIAAARGREATRTCR